MIGCDTQLVNDPIMELILTGCKKEKWSKFRTRSRNRRDRKGETLISSIGGISDGIL
jgi:hypothetical protein